MALYFEYGETETAWLRSRDAQLALAMDEIGHVHREVIPDLYAALLLQIISQQISTKGAETIWKRLQAKLGEVSPAVVCSAAVEDIQSCGMSMRKAQYIADLSRSVLDGSLDLQALHALPDDELCAQLSQIRGIGVWTAEMLMTFSMQRPNVMSYGDIAIHRGLRMLYRHRKITPQLFNRYKRRYAPYASVACLYLWEIAGGACPNLRDYAPMSEAQKKAKRKQKKTE
ncbi:DNA-3-methyladenine glycosylase 2 family protein [Clostridia bacterium OttesenSCG-928-O13]|nr:DNA-3-methyladenine glycosylase 2 family protein [Clostridia bacterium OttesenSCG-928-O13]